MIGWQVAVAIKYQSLFNNSAQGSHLIELDDDQ